MTDDERIEAEAKAMAHGLIQGYIGPDRKVLDMKRFYSALVQALREPDPASGPRPSVLQRVKPTNRRAHPSPP
jgi:hypothetical protein